MHRVNRAAELGSRLTKYPMMNVEVIKRYKYFFLDILLILLLLHGCGEESPSRNETGSEKKPEKKIEGTIVAVGDSLTEGLGVEEEFAYPAVLEDKLREQGYSYQVVNAGISGETSSGTLSRIKWVLTLKPDIVILVIGANDGLRGIEPELVKSNVRKIIQALKENNVVVVLGGMQIVENLGQDYTTAFAEIYPAIARSEDVIFIPFFLDGVAADPDLNQADGIHPTAEGYRRIVDTVYPYVRTAIKKHREEVKNPGPEDQALISPPRGGVHLKTLIGKMEWWSPARRAYGSERIME